MTQAQKEREDGKIICLIDNAPCHSVQKHLSEFHPNISIQEYRERFPNAPELSDKAREIVMKRKQAQGAAANAAAPATQQPGAAPVTAGDAERRAFNEVFGLGDAKAAFASNGRPIMIDVFERGDELDAVMIPDIDQNYVFDIANTKDILVSLFFKMPTYLWGYHGSGKTTQIEQICARTNRPFIRVQHTVDMESSAIVGQYVVKDGATEWQDGPLPIAMKMGAIYCADEYDAGLPGVIAVYQAVMEGKPLIIKEAPPEYRVVKPHPNFRFCGTGNTNGSGDETGLYQGTQIQNSANYSRYGTTIQVRYLEPAIETLAVAAQASLQKKDAAKFIDFASKVRDAHAAGSMACIVSTRELINAALHGLARSGDWMYGLKLAFINRQSKVDQEVLLQYGQRIFG